MHRIFIEQNDEAFLKLQFSQRKHYEWAEVYNNISWVLLIFIVVFNIFCSCTNQSIYIPLCSTFILAFLTVAIEKLADINIKVGAGTKEFIDSKLFNFQKQHSYGEYSREKIIEFASKVKLKHPEEYKIQTRNTGSDKIRGVKDWYTNKIAGTEEEVMLACQKENIWWNGSLTKKFFITIIILAVVVVISTLGLILAFPSRKVIVVSILSSSAVIIKIIVDTVHALNYYKFYANANSKIELIENNNNLTIGNLVKLQNDINSIRSTKFLVPNVIHKIYSKKFHEVRAEISS